MKKINIIQGFKDLIKLPGVRMKERDSALTAQRVEQTRRDYQLLKDAKENGFIPPYLVDEYIQAKIRKGEKIKVKK
jgi:hypothetical protein